MFVFVIDDLIKSDMLLSKMSNQLTIDKKIKSVLDQINKKEQEKDDYIKIIGDELKNIPISIEKQLFYICCCLVQVEFGTLLQDIRLCICKKNSQKSIGNQLVPFEDIYQNSLVETLSHFFPTKVSGTFINFNIYVMDEKDVYIDILSSGSFQEELNHLLRVSKTPYNYKWFVHCICLTDLTKIKDLPSNVNVNCLYFLHDIEFKNKKFIYKFANSNIQREIPVNLTIRKKAETLILMPKYRY